MVQETRQAGGMSSMQSTVTFEDFAALLDESKEESPLMEALKAVMMIDEPEKMAQVKAAVLWGWSWR
jgi:hypothetical protein